MEQGPRIHDISTDTDNPPRYIAVRSLSRAGKSDFGVNAKRIRKFIKQLAAA